MQAANVMVKLPESVYQHWKQKAESNNTSIEDVLADLIISSSPESEDEGSLSPELQKKLDAMRKWDTEKLKRVLAKTYSSRKSDRIENLLFKRGRGETLTDKENAEMEQIIEEQNEFMLVRAEAMVLLAERGEDVKTLLASVK
jgi:hypothetical protein